MTRAAVLLVAAVNTTILVAAQEPPATPAQTRPTGQGRGGAQPIREFLGLGRPPDPQVAARGEKLYAAACAFCHGPDARGAQAPSLLRSEIVLHDDKGEVIGPVIRNGSILQGRGTMQHVSFCDRRPCPRRNDISRHGVAESMAVAIRQPRERAARAGDRHPALGRTRRGPDQAYRRFRRLDDRCQWSISLVASRSREG